MSSTSDIPVVDVSCLADILPYVARRQQVSYPSEPAKDQLARFAETSAAQEAAAQIVDACRNVGFFYISNYPAPAGLEEQLDANARTFFKLPVEKKNEIRMSRGGRAWRGFFPVGGELTSGKPDIKEGLYFGWEAPRDDPRAVRKDPLFGQNLFPEQPQELRPAVLDYMNFCEALGGGLMVLIAIGLQLPHDYFVGGMGDDPLCLFRLFHYPPPSTLANERLRSDPTLWGVGEHTDYGLLTLLRQDEVGGLEVRSIGNRWVSAPPIRGTIVVNVGDMLEALTQGLFRSTPHRVRNTDPSAMRVSAPFFFDPSLKAEMRPLPLNPKLTEAAKTARQSRAAAGEARWDGTGANVEVKGTYGDYLLKKLTKVFPDLANKSQL